MGKLSATLENPPHPVDFPLEGTECPKQQLFSVAVARKLPFPLARRNVANETTVLAIAFPLLADFHPKGGVATAYGLWLEEPGIGDRATVLVGKDGTVWKICRRC